LPAWLDRRLPDVDLEGKNLVTSEDLPEVKSAPDTAGIV
jgi:hypothetical protein